MKIKLTALPQREDFYHVAEFQSGNGRRPRNLDDLDAHKAFLATSAIGAAKASPDHKIAMRGNWHDKGIDVYVPIHKAMAPADVLRMDELLTQATYCDLLGDNGESSILLKQAETLFNGFEPSSAGPVLFEAVRPIVPVVAGPITG